MAERMFSPKSLRIFFLIGALAAAPSVLCAAEPAIAPSDTDLRAFDPREEAHLTVVELERRVSAGDMKAQAELGARYGSGQGVKQDLPKAITLLQAAAAKNDPDAQFFLGTAYATGLGVPQNDAQSVMLYEEAADQGQPAANYALANMIIAGKGGISPSWSGALHNLWNAAAKGYPLAMIQIGQLYQDGKGTDRNPRAAAYWYRRALQLIPDVRTIYNLRVLIERREIEWEPGDPGEPKDPIKTVSSDAPAKSAGLTVPGLAAPGLAAP
jgi:TPR repeat protein